MTRVGKDNITEMLPVEAWLKGLRLLVMTPTEWIKDHTIRLTDSNGHAIREWYYTPSLGEIDDVCKEVLA